MKIITVNFLYKSRNPVMDISWDTLRHFRRVRGALYNSGIVADFAWGYWEA